LPFCTNCGSSVDPHATFCHQCGTRQPRTIPQYTDFLAGLSDHAACVLCYIPVFGVIPAIIFLASHKYRGNHRVRFDAFQALYLFLAWLLVHSAAPALLFASFPGSGIEHAILGILKIVLFVCWIYLLVKAARNEQVKLPIIGDLAARSTTEQL